MQNHFGELKDTDWCLCKAAAAIRQLAYEVCEGDSEELRELDDFVDEVWGQALGRDLSGCLACVEDGQSDPGPSGDSVPLPYYPEASTSSSRSESHNS